MSQVKTYLVLPLAFSKMFLVQYNQPYRWEGLEVGWKQVRGVPSRRWLSMSWLFPTETECLQVTCHRLLSLTRIGHVVQVHFSWKMRERGGNQKGPQIRVKHWEIQEKSTRMFLVFFRWTSCQPITPWRPLQEQNRRWDAQESHWGVTGTWKGENRAGYGSWSVRWAQKRQQILTKKDIAGLLFQKMNTERMKSFRG